MTNLGKKVSETSMPSALVSSSADCHHTLDNLSLGSSFLSSFVSTVVFLHTERKRWL